MSRLIPPTTPTTNDGSFIALTFPLTLTFCPSFVSTFPPSIPLISPSILWFSPFIPPTILPTPPSIPSFSTSIPPTIPPINLSYSTSFPVKTPFTHPTTPLATLSIPRTTYPAFCHFHPPNNS